MSTCRLSPILSIAIAVVLTLPSPVRSQGLEPPFVRGDVNQDGAVDLGDPVAILEFLAGLATAPDCDDAADANDDEVIDIADPITILSHLFIGTGPLPAPTTCGVDPTPGALDCATFASCAAGGTFPASWIHGSPSCASDPNPPAQVHFYDASTVIIRQNKCIDFEAPFLYLFFGTERALLLDTGATSSSSVFPIGNLVSGLVDDWQTSRGLPSYELVVAHTHGHGDHTAGDGQFIGQPDTTVVSASLASVTSFFGITDWPEQTVEFDLGERVVDLIPIPGHSSADVAYYDRATDLLVTGDSLYPGYIFVNDSNWAAYSSSIARLHTFAATRPIAAVLGTHVEMTSTPGVAYPYGTTYQPNERELQLDFAHLEELHLAVQAMGSSPVTEVHDDFILQIY